MIRAVNLNILRCDSRTDGEVGREFIVSRRGSASPGLSRFENQVGATLSNVSSWGIPARLAASAAAESEIQGEVMVIGHLLFAVAIVAGERLYKQVR